MKTCLCAGARGAHAGRARSTAPRRAVELNAAPRRQLPKRINVSTLFTDPELRRLTGARD